MEIGGVGGWLGCVCGDRQSGAHRMEIWGVGWVLWLETVESSIWYGDRGCWLGCVGGDRQSGAHYGGRGVLVGLCMW